MITHAEPEQDRAGYCWVILAVAFVFTFITLGMRSTLGVFFKAMIDDLGWSRGTLSMVAAVNIWLGGLLTPFIGYVMDRHGARWLFIVSSVVFGVGFGLIGLSYSVAYLLVVYGLVLALAMAGTSVALCNALVARWFPTHRRGMALGISNSAMAVGSNSNFGPDAVEQGPRKVTTTVSHWAIVNNFVQNGRISVTLIDM